jgi:hypothetical protein
MNVTVGPNPAGAPCNEGEECDSGICKIPTIPNTAQSMKIGTCQIHFEPLCLWQVRDEEMLCHKQFETMCSQGGNKCDKSRFFDNGKKCIVDQGVGKCQLLS